MGADEQAKKILVEWSELQGHDRCWWYPEYIEPLAELYGLSLDNILLTPNRNAFNCACIRFREEQYGRKPEIPVKYDTVKACLANWIDEQRGKEYAYQDEILQDLATILGVVIPSTPNVSRSELEQGCERFQTDKYS